MQKETLITIAERTGFSISTISRVLNGKAQKYRIAAKTVKTITEEARKCNYQPNLTAQSLRTRRTNTIGLMVPSIDNPFFANIANVIIHEARLYKYTVILIDSMENEKDEREGISRFAVVRPAAQIAELTDVMVITSFNGQGVQADE